MALDGEPGRMSCWCCVMKAGRGCAGYQSAASLPSRPRRRYSNTPAIKRTLGSQHAVHSDRIASEEETHHHHRSSQSLLSITWLHKNCECSVYEPDKINLLSASKYCVSEQTLRLKSLRACRMLVLLIE